MSKDSSIEVASTIEPGSYAWNRVYQGATIVAALLLLLSAAA